MSPWQSETGVQADVRLNGRGWVKSLMLHVRRPAAVVFIEPAGVLAWRKHDVQEGAVNPSAHDDFASWCAASPRVSARLVISGHLLHSHGLPIDAEHRAAPREAARRVFVRYHGRAAERWDVAAAVDANAMYACALHGFDLDATRAAAAAREITLKSAVPLWAEALPAAAARASALVGARRATLAWVEGTLVTCLDLEGGRLAGIEQRHLDEASVDAFKDLLARRRAEAAGESRLVFAGGWGLAGDLRDDSGWQPIGRVDGTAAAAAWLFRPGREGES